MDDILLLVVKKTDSAGWLGVLLPWSWNRLRDLGRLLISLSPRKARFCGAPRVFAGAADGEVPK